MIVERIEENIVIIEDGDGKYFETAIDLFPEDIKEGDCIIRTDDGFTIDTEKTSELRKKMIELQNSLWN